MMKDFVLIHKSHGEVDEKEKLKKWFNRFLDRMPDGDYELWFQPTTKTQKQNNYYWSQVTKMAFSLGMSPADLHDELKDRFLPTERFIVFIKDKRVPSTRGLTIDLMSKYLEDCIRFSAEECDFVWGDPEEYKHTQ